MYAYFRATQRTRFTFVRQVVRRGVPPIFQRSRPPPRELQIHSFHDTVDWLRSNNPTEGGREAVTSTDYSPCKECRPLGLDESRLTRCSDGTSANAKKARRQKRPAKWHVTRFAALAISRGRSSINLTSIEILPSSISLAALISVSPLSIPAAILRQSPTTPLSIPMCLNLSLSLSLCSFCSFVPPSSPLLCDSSGTYEEGKREERNSERERERGK